MREAGCALTVGFLQVAFGDLLGAAGIVVGLLGLAVFVDGALALRQHVEDFSEIDVAPDLGPFFGGFRNGLQSFAEGVGAA